LSSETQTLYISLISSCPSFGAAVGSLFATYINLKYGRRKSMLIADIIAIIGTGLTLIKDPNGILIGRILVGFSIGINSVVVNIY